MARVYLDHNATSPIRPQAMDAMVRALQLGGNPSSVHALGRSARALVEDGRSEVAALVGAAASRLVFTGGGTEANALGIGGVVSAGGIGRLIIGATEHDAVSKTAIATGLPVEIWPVDAHGVADLNWLADRLAVWNPADGRPLVALMLANNETGVIQPVAEASALVRAVDGLLHVDGVQAAGKIGAWGVSNLDLADMDELARAGGQTCAVDQILYNVTRRGAEFALMPALSARNIPVMAYSPMEQGKIPNAGALAAVAARHGATAYQVALAWVLRRPDVIAIPKAANIAHVRENRAAADLVLTPADLAEIDAAFPPPARKTRLEML